ncbi:hypothetical protein FJ432_28065 [Mesorhizobium sp. B2-6-5]|nr:hypothetical protein FJ432_28065 [Mesorhizobium sp. B2-6-5]
MRSRWWSQGGRRSPAHQGPKRSGGRYGSDFVVARGMTAQPAGEESRDVPLRHRRPRRSRPSDQKHQSKRPLSVCSPRQDLSRRVGGLRTYSIRPRTSQVIEVVLPRLERVQHQTSSTWQSHRSD